MNVEREVKLGAPSWFRMPSLEGIGGPGTTMEPRPVQDLETTYLDTPDLRLTRWGICLRLRAGHGWTVKLPIEETEGLLVRSEMEFAGDDPASPPEEALDLLRAFVRSSSLRPVLVLRTLRHPTVIHDPRGHQVAEVVDDTATIALGGSGGFREVEIELAEDAPAGLVDELMTRLRSAGAGAPDPTPKYVRALSPVSAGRPEVSPATIGGHATAGQVIRHTLARSVANLLRHDPVVRLDADPEGVHQARVATRRLRSDLRTFLPMLEPGWTDALRVELRWLGDALGQARDTDVLLDRMRELIANVPDAESPGAADAVETLERQDKGAHAAVLEVLRSDRYVALLDRLVAAANEPALLPAADGFAGESLPSLVREPWKALRSAIKEGTEKLSDDDLHGIRIHVKRVRYAAEAVAPVGGREARRFAEAAAELQGVLGEHHDAVVAEAWLREWAAGRPPAGAFAAGMLGGIERAAAADARSRWRKAWRALDDRKLRSWM